MIVFQFDVPSIRASSAFELAMIHLSGRLKKFIVQEEGADANVHHTSYIRVLKNGSVGVQPVFPPGFEITEYRWSVRMKEARGNFGRGSDYVKT